MARTATFKANERFTLPTGLIPSSPASAEGEDQAAEETEAPAQAAEVNDAQEAALEDVLSSEGAEEASSGSESDAESAEETIPEQDYPAGDPNSTWRVAEIDAWAAAQSPEVVFDQGSTKNQKLEAIKGLSTTSEG